jgi:hypothetical protein
MKIHRQILKAIDIEVAFSKSKSTSAKMLRTVKIKLEKEKHQHVTIDDFCTYYGLEKQYLVDIIINNDTLKKQRKQTIKTEVEECVPAPMPKPGAEQQAQRVKGAERYTFTRRASYE